MNFHQIVFLVGCVIVQFGEATSQEHLNIPKQTQELLTPGQALDRVREEHTDASPIVVAQGELDRLIDPDGGGACPLSAALIGLQGLRAMADLPMHPHPHRLALQLFQAKPELKEGRISNERFVDLLAFLCKELDDSPVSMATVSAPNSEHAGSGQRWLETDGPDLTTSKGELKFLSYTVTTADGTVRGRHFVLLKENNEGKLSFLNPASPLKQRFFLVEYRGVPTATKQRVFFVVPDGLDKSHQTYELNTIFTVRFLTDDADESTEDAPRVETIKAKVDLLADQLRSSGELTSPIAWRRRGAAFGLPGVDLPVKVGGGGYSASEAIELFRHAGRINLNLRDVIGGAHGRPLTKSSTALSQDVLRKLVAGEAYVAVAITEPTAGTDMKAMKSKAVRFEAGFKLTGRKLWNARLHQATHVVLYTLASDDKDGERSAFLIPIDHPGLKVVDRYAHGLTGNSFGGLEFDDMFVSRDHLLGEDGDGGEIFNEHFQYWRLMQAAAAIGCGEAALDQMAERITSREAFGAPIGRFTHLQQPLGEYLTKLRMAMSLAREAAQMIDNGDYESATPLVNGLKAEGVEIALSACDTAMRAHGAMGYSRQTDLGDRVRDLMGLRIADGTTDVMRMTVVRDEYGSDLWKMAIYGVRDVSESSPEDEQQPVSAE